MDLDAKQIQSLLENSFWDVIYQEVSDCVDRLEEEDWRDCFDSCVDTVMLETIEQIKIMSWESETEEEEAVVSGTLEVLADLDGYAYWDGESIYMDSGLLRMGFSFEFSVIGEECGNLYLTYEY